MKVKIEELGNKTKENTEYMTLENNEYTAKIVYIYDGDTMHVVLKNSVNISDGIVALVV